MFLNLHCWEMNLERTSKFMYMYDAIYFFHFFFRSHYESFYPLNLHIFLFKLIVIIIESFTNILRVHEWFQYCCCLLLNSLQLLRKHLSCGFEPSLYIIILWCMRTLKQYLNKSRSVIRFVIGRILRYNEYL